ncbi:ATP-dependent DNA ligase [Candidatus Microgenomates bacterium]|nr:MAG: ATP-dependent DNA ligase [Candidatus Microgenomates bacterium]
MYFYDLAQYFQKLEDTASRLTITEILAQLYKELNAQEAKQVSYLLQGRVAPVFAPIEFGIADKMMIRSIAIATGTKDTEVLALFKKLGDFGSVAQEVKRQKAKGKSESQKFPPKADQPLAEKIKNTNQKLKIIEVFESLLEIALSTGSGSQEKKLQLLADLLSRADPLSARFIVRIPLGKLRLGFSDMTILDALSWMEMGSKAKRKDIERAYNVRPDLGFIAETIKKKKIAGLAHVTPTVGTPILMARANRLTSAEDIILKIGKCAVEFKYDGLRLQVHYRQGKSEIKMFSRNLEDVTPMFPDIVEAVQKQITADEVILEGEIVAYNPKTGVHVPFQETMQRKRKYNIAEKALEIPVKLYAFELLFLNGKNYIHEPYIERKKQLRTIISKGKTLVYAQEHIVAEKKQVETLFDESVSLNFEGIIAKKLNGTYEAGMRGWNWIKYKKAMNTQIADTVDVVVMGYTLGEGKRTSFGVGQFLAGIYDDQKDLFLTVTKVGTGLTDEQFKEFIKRTEKLKINAQPKNYLIDKLLEPDVWLKPSLIVELGADEITRSPVHTAGRIMGPSKSGTAQEVKTPGYALRFPRLVRFRDDKKATDATTVKEIKDLFAKQR